MVTATSTVLARRSRDKIEIGRKTLWGLAIGLTGIMIAGAGVYWNALSNPPDRSPGRVLCDMTILVGMALFSMGVFSVLLDMKSWKDYFEEGIKGIVLQREYLRTLSLERLQEHQIDIFKTYYREADIDREGRFLRYCLDHIHRYVVRPYREEIHDRIRVQAVDSDLLRITDTLTYTCRRAGGGIQDRVFWQANAKEVLAMEDLKIELCWPKGHKDADKKVPLSVEDLEAHHQPDGSLRFEYDLRPYAQLDGLIVQAEATYLAHVSSFQTWRMADPSRSVDLRIAYPPTFELQFLPYLLDHEPDDCVDDRGVFFARFRSWVMPKSGFAWKLIPPALARKVELGSLEQAETLGDVIDDGGD